VARPKGWDAEAAIAACAISPWQGSAWRGHRRKYVATDPGGSRKVSGRYNRGLDQFPADQVFAALYLGLGRDICIGEILRHISPVRLSQLTDYRFSELRLELEVVLDCRDVTALGLAPADLWHDTDYRIPQHLAAAALTRDVEGMLVPSATRLGDNLIVFPDHLRAGSQIVVEGFVDPHLYVPRP
jgi:hypothetical protein